jgi:chemotaxis protein MotB
MSPATHEQDESYFVSMTDLMVGMLFVFIILLMAFALNLKDQEERLRQTDEVRVQILERIARTLQQQGVNVTIDTKSGVLRLPEEILFATGEHTLQPKGLVAVDKLRRVLGEILPCFAGPVRRDAIHRCAGAKYGRLDSVFIEGHTDSQPVSGLQNGNWTLSYQRAQTVYDALTSKDKELRELSNDRVGPNGDRQSLFGVSGYADQRPVASNSNAEGMKQNRRIDLRFIMAMPDPDPQDGISNALGVTQSKQQ